MTYLFSIMQQELTDEWLTVVHAQYVISQNLDCLGIDTVRFGFANQLATSAHDKAHAVLTPDRQNGYTVSVRAPMQRLHGADVLCALFGGSGRPAAAGIDHLPRAQVAALTAAFATSFQDF
jgi:ribulose 1,5-bisphosphate carboxylase large subunit-like protein